MRRVLPALVVASAASACSTGVLPEGVTEQSERVTDVWDLFVPVALVVWALVWGLVLWVLVRYRRRDDDVPGQRQYLSWLEITYTVVPFVVVGALWVVSWQAGDDLTDVSGEPDVEIEVVGFQWQWAFNYREGGDVARPVSVLGAPGDRPELLLPVGRTVHFDLVANDVIHSFWVPEFLEKRDLIPGIDNVVEVVVAEEGRWRGRCAEFCGLDHWRMTFDVRAVPPEEFEAWVARQDEPRSAP